MGREIDYPMNEQAANWLAYAKYRVLHEASDVGRGLVVNAKEKMLVETPRDYPPGYDDLVDEKITQVDEATGKGIYYPVIFGTHKSHAGAFPALVEGIRIQAKTFQNYQRTENGLLLRGNALLVAQNIENGQNGTITKYFEEIQPIFNNLSTVTIPVLREKDAEKLDKSSLTTHRIRQGRAILTAIDNGLTLVALPEGSVESGRQKEDGRPGEINGMIPLEKGSVSYLCALIKKRGYEPLLFFVGNTGENKLYDPITETVPLSAKLRALPRMLPGGKEIVPSLMSSVFDYPTSLQEILDELGPEAMENGALEQYAGERMAQLIPHHERGRYARPRLLYALPSISRRDTADIFPLAA